jgi:hypothetical protein
MPYETIEQWIKEENGHQASTVDQILTAYWLYRNEITVPHGKKKRTSEVDNALDQRLDHETDTVLENLLKINVVEKFEPPSRVFIQNERTNDAFFSPNDEAFPPSLFGEISRLVYNIHLQEGRGEDGSFPGQLHPPEISPVADGGDPSAEETPQRRSLRAFIAEELDVPPSDVERALVGFDDIIECMEQFDELVESIKESDEVSREVEFDQVGWRNRANRWALSETAKNIEENESLPI